jgi:hypothetical protein
VKNKITTGFLNAKGEFTGIDHNKSVITTPSDAVYYRHTEHIPNGFINNNGDIEKPTASTPYKLSNFVEWKDVTEFTIGSLVANFAQYKKDRTILKTSIKKGSKLSKMKTAKYYRISLLL